MKKIIIIFCFLSNFLHALALEEMKDEPLQGAITPSIEADQEEPKSETNVLVVGESPPVEEGNLQYPQMAEVQQFSKLFERVHFISLLEVGMGDSTKFFLDRLAHVTSLKIISEGQTDDQYSSYQELFKSYLNWNPILYSGSSSLNWADSRTKELEDPALMDAGYLLELSKLIYETTDKEYDIAFVHPTLHFRGDLVNCLFDRVELIAALGTNHPIYGWNKIYTPSNYQKIEFAEGDGITFWVKKNRLDIIEALGGNTALSPSREKLRIFFPHSDLNLERMVAKSFKFLGHSLLVPGSSFDDPQELFSITSQKASTQTVMNAFTEELKRSVEIVEIKDILANPPDILFITSQENEAPILKLYLWLKRTKPSIKLVYFSGYHSTDKYSPLFCKNLIALNGTSARSFQDQTVNHIIWFPWVDTDHPVAVPEEMEIHSYLKPDSTREFRQYEDFTSRFLNSHKGISFTRMPPFEGTFQSMKSNCCAILHCEDAVGSGYTIADTLASGCPVFLYRPLFKNSRLMDWCIEGKTAFFFETYEEFEKKLETFFSSFHRTGVSQRCQDSLKLLINNEKQARILQNFFDHLK